MDTPGERIPMSVVLADGTTCTYVTRDSSRHYRTMRSWFSCDDGSELLSQDDVEATFDRSKLWTAQRSVNKQKPTAAKVATAVFADVDA